MRSVAGDGPTQPRDCFMVMPAWRLSVFALAAMLVATPGLGDAPGQDSGGIGHSEYVRTFPPPPVSVHASIADGKPLIVWQAPEHPSSGELAYDPEIAEYRVYTVRGLAQRTLVGTTATTSYHDVAARSGATRDYAVTAVQRSGQESDLSLTVSVQVP